MLNYREQWERNSKQMGEMRKRHRKEFKAHVALEALKGHKTLSELAREFGVHLVQLSQ